jgi:hypothetical protein
MITKMENTGEVGDIVFMKAWLRRLNPEYNFENKSGNELEKEIINTIREGGYIALDFLVDLYENAAP